MSSYDDYQKDAIKVGKEPGKLSKDDIEFLASQSKDCGKTYMLYEMFNESDKRSVGNGFSSSEGCYIATCVYGSYDCPEVWTLRRFRDFKLRKNLIGRWFIRLYYAVSPTLVKWFGNTLWFNRFWKAFLESFVGHLRKKGYADTPYRDT